MKQETIDRIEAAIHACANKATVTKSSIEALQYTQAMLNAVQSWNAITIALREAEYLSKN